MIVGPDRCRHAAFRFVAGRGGEPRPAPEVGRWQARWPFASPAANRRCGERDTQSSTHLSVYVVLVLPFDVNKVWSPTALPFLSPRSSVTAVLNSTELKTVTSANQSTLTV